MKHAIVHKEPLGVEELKGSQKHTLIAKPHQLALFLQDTANQLGSGPVPPNVLNGLCTYFAKKDLLKPASFAEDVDCLLHTVERLNNVMGGQDFYKSNAFRYLYEGRDCYELADQIVANAQFWTQLFGAEFFARYSTYSKERGTILRADLDEDFYLSCKGGSGMGTFSVDFAIGTKGRSFAMNVPAAEIWRSGLDTQQTAGSTALRIIRSGSGTKKCPKKGGSYETFVQRYGTTPQRMLAFLAMYVGKDLAVDEIKALSSEGVRSKRHTLLGHNQVNFNYTGLFESVGFQPSESDLWLTMGNPADNFYPTLCTTPQNQKGLRGNEVSPLNKVIQAFRQLRDITQTGLECPLTVASNDTRAEVVEAIETFKTIQGK